jgi:hypothetical protein
MSAASAPDSTPAWQRAAVGDVVLAVFGGTSAAPYRVVGVDDANAGARLLVATARGDAFLENHRVLAVQPAEDDGA